MNPEPDNTGLPLDELQITPQWMRAPVRSFENHPGERPDRKGDRFGRERGPRPSQPSRENRPPRDNRPPRGTRPLPPRRPEERRPAPVAPPTPAPIEVSFLPEEIGFVAMVATIKQSPRAYAIFDIAKLVLNKPERHVVVLKRPPVADGQPAPLFLVPADGEVFLTQEEALRHALRRHGEKIFKIEKKPVDPPKGNFTFVGRCGLTGVWLGPPNHHDYQTTLVRHHQSRLRHLPFAEFQARIQTVRDEAAVKAWLDSKSFVTEFQCLLDTEPQTFATRDELEKHIRETHAAQLVTAATEFRLSGKASRELAHPGISEAVREAWMAERRFPLKTATQVSDRLRSEGLHFFKHRKAITYITTIKLKRFESLTGMSERVQSIVNFLRTHEGATRKQLLAALLPPPADVPAPATPTVGAAEGILADLHWLVAEGHVVEFATGKLWALEDRPPKPPEPPPAPPAAPAAEAPATAEPTPVVTEPPPAPGNAV